MSEPIAELFRRVAPPVDFCSLRFVDERSEMLHMRQNVLQPVARSTDTGAMVTVIDGGGLGYAATSDLSARGLEAACAQARTWAERTARRAVTDFSRVPMPSPQGQYATPVAVPWESTSLADKIALLQRESERLKVDPRIVDWEAALWHTRSRTLYLTNQGGHVEQEFSFLVPLLSATANEGSETQTRSLGGRGYCRQGGLEVLEDAGFFDAAPRLAGEALALLAAPNCPTGAMDVLLAPDQMILQIHESIGHPLELDRILGDERNYAGTSFVTLDMFGSYRYGSDLLNITYDPTLQGEFASFGFDDDGVPARKEHIIRKGILERPLGSIISQQRAGIAGVANARASSWNRPPIDRMANLNLEPGTATLDEMIAAVEHGIYMQSNNSWSIDDSRNKFQFGCEWGQLIENGKLTTLVKKPNYRGISATFWRSLKMVGSVATRNILGTPNCGKGEPNQAVRVGHASPACLFANVDVFGGA
jgi:predicted Zn-dependent protease